MAVDPTRSDRKVPQAVGSLALNGPVSGKMPSGPHMNGPRVPLHHPQPHEASALSLPHVRPLVVGARSLREPRRLRARYGGGGRHGRQAAGRQRRARPGTGGETQTGPGSRRQGERSVDRCGRSVARENGRVEARRRPRSQSPGAASTPVNASTSGRARPCGARVGVPILTKQIACSPGPRPNSSRTALDFNPLPEVSAEP